jgi:hypothetical protein
MRGLASRMNSKNTKKKMADITKCTGRGCDLRETCYRFTATAGWYQSYFMTSPVKNGECEMYWETNTNER